jgi:histidine phosphotransfer protein HptB
MADQITIEVDEDLCDLVPGFLARKRGELEAMRDCPGAHDYSEVGRTAHRIKGEGGAYGFDRMSVVGRELEEAATARDDAEIAGLASGLLKYLDSVEIVFRPSEE